jgi:hypothetical protein
MTRSTTNNNSLTVVKSEQPAADERFKHFLEFGNLDRKFDDLVKIYNSLRNDLGTVPPHVKETCTRRSADVPDEVAKLVDDLSNTMAAFGDWHPGAFDPVEHDDVAERVAFLLASFPNLRPPAESADLFVDALIVHILDERPLLVVLESACRELERTEEFFSIAKVVSALRRHKVHWQRRVHVWGQGQNGTITKIGDHLLIQIQQRELFDERVRQRLQRDREQFAKDHPDSKWQPPAIRDRTADDKYFKYLDRLGIEYELDGFNLLLHLKYDDAFASKRPVTIRDAYDNAPRLGAAEDDIEKEDEQDSRNGEDDDV